MDGLLSRGEVRELVQKHMLPRLATHGDDGLVYGEKHVYYGPFLDLIYEAHPCRIVHLHRDGRDVVRSMIDWHTGKFGNIYREANSAELLSEEALIAARGLRAHLDESDYSRPRPQPGTDLYASWQTFPRHEMSAWYWSECNHVLLEQLDRLPASASRRVDLADGLEAVEGIFDFLGLERLSHDELATMLDSRINSLDDRGSSSPEPFPHWQDWDSGQRDRFEWLAGDTMARLGYWKDERTRWRPRDFGSTWTDRTDVPEWYEWMYETRRPQHERLISFIEARDDLRTIVDVGCGVGVGYHDAFADRTYVGVDLSRSNIEWCRAHRKNPGHRYLCVDHATTDPDPGEIGDIAFSQGTIDNAWDVDAFLTGMVRWSRGFIYVTCYRGWFPELDEHRYQWSMGEGVFYNDVSPGRTRRTLEKLGCTEIEIIPLGGEGLPCRETVITARVPGLERGRESYA